ncbi:MAG: S8 family serine peptidase [bacterium]|nr:S8 family serine peptidase [bacterium]
MKLKFLTPVCFSLLILVFSVSTLSANTQKVRREGKVRLLAHSREEAQRAEQSGCRQVRKVKEIKAFVCPLSVARSLGLPEDIRVMATDTRANSQIRANLVQNSGNSGQGRKVAILDTGYNYTHPELSSSYLGGRDFVNGDEDPTDDNGHGSHVAGIITADGVNSSAKGAAPSVGILVGKVLDKYGSGYFTDIIAGIYWVVDGPDGVSGNADDPGVDAVNLSLGTGAPYLYKSFCDSVYPEMTTAIKHARDRGVLVVVAAGNSGSSGVSLPGCISYSTTVGAVNSRDRIASFSGRGKGVDITAPGVGIFSSWLGSGYLTASGTSMATPIVTATVGLVRSVHSGYNPDQVENALFKTAKDLGTSGKDNKFGWGRVDAQSAVNY